MYSKIKMQTWHWQEYSGIDSSDRQILHKNPDPESSGPQTGGSRRWMDAFTEEPQTKWRNPRRDTQTQTQPRPGQVSWVGICTVTLYLWILFASLSVCARSHPRVRGRGGRSQERSWSQQADSSHTKLNLCTLTMKRLWEMLGRWNRWPLWGWAAFTTRSHPLYYTF